MTGQLPLGGYPDPQSGKLSLDIGSSRFPPTGDPRFDSLPDDQKERIFKGMMSDLVPPGDLLDLESGAPASVRGTVGALQSPDDRMRAMQAAYPQGDVQRYGDENFTFLEPATGRRTAMNPPGLDVGDFPGAAPEIAGAAGSTLGAIAGAAGGPAGMIAGAGLGGQAAREAARYGIQQYTDQPDTRSTRDRLLSAGSEAAIDAAGQGLGMGVPAAARAVFGARPGRNAGQLIQDFTDIGAPLEAATITGNPALRGVASSTAPQIGGGPIEDAIQGMQSAVQRGVQRETGQLAPGGVGTKMQTGGGLQLEAEAADRRVRDQLEQLYDAAWARIGAYTPVTLTNVGRLRTQLAQQLMQGRGAQAAELRPILQRIDRILAPRPPSPGAPPQAQAIPFESLRRVRTDIGRMTKGRPVGHSESAQQDNLNALYGALTEDMNTAARAAGGQRELEAADALMREFNAPQGPGPALQSVRDAPTPERAFDVLKGMKGSQLMLMRRQMGQRQWNEFVATTLEGLGRANPGAIGAAGMGGPAGDFSVSTFLTNFNKLQENPEVYQALFGGRDYAALRTALERLLRVSTAIRETAPTVVSTGGSQTAARTAPIAQAGTALAGAQMMMSGRPLSGAAVIGGALAPFLTSRLMTNARFVNWLAGARQGATRQGVEGLGPWIGRLSSVAVAEPKLKDDIEALMRQMTGRMLQKKPEINTTSTGGIRG